MSAVKMASIGLVHDYLLVMRGAERTFECLTRLWPDAQVHTLLYDEEGTEERFAGHEITTSALQRLGPRQQNFRRLLPLLPLAVQRMPVGAHDLVISSSSAFAHGVPVRAGARHLCYCHSPFRYAWHERQSALQEAPPLLRPQLRALLAGIRRWDRHLARRDVQYIANSAITRDRIRRFWSRDAPVIHPPVELSRFAPRARENYFLIVTELVRHKRVELALSAAQAAGCAVKVVGTGPDLARLRSRFDNTAEFLGRVSDADLPEIYARARAVVVPGVEEFGIVAVEAQASGTPVLGPRAGGLKETVVADRTGVLVDPGDPDALAAAMRRVDFDSFPAERLTEQAARFSSAAFQEQILAHVDADGPLARPA